MVGIVGVGQRLIATGEEVEIVAVIAMASDDRVVASGDHDDIIGPSISHFIECAVGGVNLLDGVALRFLNLVEVSFLQARFTEGAVIVHLTIIMLVGELQFPEGV